MNPADFKKVAVLLGGDSSEREVSLSSGQGILDALLRQGFDAHRFDPLERDIAQLAHFDRVFNILHGGRGENGAVQGLLDCLGIPYTGSGMLACALAMDKWRCKLVWQAAGLPIIEYALVDSGTNYGRLVDWLGLPMFVKPACEGSSVGVTKVKSLTDLAAAYAEAAKYDRCVIAERMIGGGEYTVGIVGDRVLPPIRIIPETEFYDYQAKYERDDTHYLIPCGLAPADEARMQSLAREAFAILGGRGWGRIDILADETGNFYLLEANLVPGMTTHSLVPKAAAAIGIDYDALATDILARAAHD